MDRVTELALGGLVETLKKGDILQQVLSEYGYFGWYVIEPSKLKPANFLLLNPKEKKMAEVLIPNEWIGTQAETAQSENRSDG